MELSDSRRQGIPSKILLQLKDGAHPNVLSEFNVDSLRQFEVGGIKEHEVTNTSVIRGLGIAMKDYVEACRKSGDKEIESWLSEIKSYIFD